MTTKFDIGEEVLILDFEEDCKKEGRVVGITINALGRYKTEFGDILLSNIEINYEVECNDAIYERSESHIFKTEDECKEYLIEKFGLC